MSLHENILGEVNIIFVNWPLNPRGCSLNPPGPPRPSRYFGLPMVNLGRPPLPSKIPYHQPLEYVKDFDLNVHVRVFKVAIRTNNETNDAEIVNLFSF